MALFNKAPIFKVSFALCIVGFVSFLCGMEKMSLSDKQEIRNKQEISVLVSTPYTLKTYIPRDVLTKCIWPFLLPCPSYRVPIDFITHATIIPKEWGYLCGIQRNKQGKLKVLTCKTTAVKRSIFAISNALLRLGLGGVLANVGANLIFPVSRDSGVVSWILNAALTVLSVRAFGLVEKFDESLSNSFYKSYEIAVWGLQSMSKEAYITGSCRADEYPHAYFLDKVDIIEICMNSHDLQRSSCSPQAFRVGEGMRRFQPIDLPQDDKSKAIRAGERTFPKVSKVGNLRRSRQLLNELLGEYNNNSNQHVKEMIKYKLRVIPCCLFPRDLYGYTNSEPLRFYKIAPYLTCRADMGLPQSLLLVAYEDEDTAASTLAVVQMDSERALSQALSQECDGTAEKARIRLPFSMNQFNTYASRMASDASAIVLHVYKYDANKLVTVVLDVNTKKLSEPLEFLLESIITDQSTEGLDDITRSGNYSFGVLGDVGCKKIIDNLRYFCDVDKDRLKVERLRTEAEKAAAQQRRNKAAWLARGACVTAGAFVAAKLYFKSKA